MIDLPEREHQALQMRKQGKDLDSIAEALDMTRSGANKLITRAIARYTRESIESAEEIRETESVKLDQAEANIQFEMDTLMSNKEIDQRDKIPMMAQLHSMQMKVMERRAKMLGLDAAQKVEANVITTSFEQALKTIEQEVFQELQTGTHQGLIESDDG